jgi:hypothetical protein
MSRILGARLLPFALILCAAPPAWAVEEYPEADFSGFRCEIDLDQSFPELGAGSLFTFDSTKSCAADEVGGRVELRCHGQVPGSDTPLPEGEGEGEPTLSDEGFPCLINVVPCGLDDASCDDGFCTATESSLMIDHGGNADLRCVVQLGTSPEPE